MKVEQSQDSVRSKKGFMKSEPLAKLYEVVTALGRVIVKDKGDVGKEGKSSSATQKIVIEDGDIEISVLYQRLRIDIVALTEGSIAVQDKIRMSTNFAAQITYVFLVLRSPR